ADFSEAPKTPTAKKPISPPNFNYPVDPGEFEKRIHLVLKGREGATDQPLKFTVAYDAAKLRAFIHSEPLALPRDDDTVVLTLDAGVKSLRGGDGSKAALQMAVNVPGLYSLKLRDVNPTLVNNDKYKPEQVLLLTATDAVKGPDLAAIARAWVLPKRKPGVKQDDSEAPYEWDVSEVGEDVLKRSKP